MDRFQKGDRSLEVHEVWETLGEMGKKEGVCANSYECIAQEKSKFGVLRETVGNQREICMGMQCCSREAPDPP